MIYDIFKNPKGVFHFAFRNKNILLGSWWI